MTTPAHLVLVIGCGSIGERHVRTFLASDRAAVLACDNRLAIWQQMTERYGVESDGCEGKPNLLCTLEEGIRTLRINLAALQSWRENRPVTL